MYGMVNQFVITTIINSFGEQKVAEIEELLDFDINNYLTAKTYPDEQIYQIIAAAVKVLKIEQDELLEFAGKEWVKLVGNGPYKLMLDPESFDLFGFLSNLNSMHASIASQLPELKPPSFISLQKAPFLIEVQYFSNRPGLTYFVLGLLKGLCSHFNVEADVAIGAMKKDSNTDHDKFLISMKDN